MLASIRFTLVLGSLALVAGCSTRRPPAPRAPSSVAESSTPRGVGDASAPGTRAEEVEAHAAAAPLPKVVRRILAEQKDLVARSQAMANELPDPRGRARAIAEVNELAQELARIAQPVAGAAGHDQLATTPMSAWDPMSSWGQDSGTEITSDVLDEIVSALLLLDTRLSLLHEKLRAATERTTAVLVE